MYCSFCRSNKHTMKNCPHTYQGQINRMNMRCTYCGSNKHNVKGCPLTYEGSAKRAWHEREIDNEFIKD